MKLMRCPLNGLRNIQEFSCGGEVLAPPGEQSRDAGAWAGYLFMHDNPAGVVREWWYHVPTSYWFIAERDTVHRRDRRDLPRESPLPRRRRLDAHG